MESIFIDFLFSKHLLVDDAGAKEASFETLFSLANLFNIRILSGQELAQPDMIRTAERCIGRQVPSAFYRGFPASVKGLSRDQKLFDQLLHYYVTYGCGDFSWPGHSLFEKDFERAAFRESADIKDFSIITEEEAVRRLGESVDDLLAGTRPLSESQYELVLSFIKTYGHQAERCASKDTAVKLLLDTRDPAFASFVQLSDVIRVLDHLSYETYKNENLKKLNLKNQDRKFLTQIIDTIFREGQCNTADCFEKKKIWNGLLHHIHYRPVNEKAEAFVKAIRARENLSVYSAFEKHMRQGEIREAVQALRGGKGSGALLRNLTYILSRCTTQEDVEFVLRSIKTDNPLILIQLFMEYSSEKPSRARTFKFTRHHLFKKHTETQEERDRRQSFVSDEVRAMVPPLLLKNLEEIYRGRLGKVYIAPEMERIAVPLQETTASSGFGVLPRGSRVPIRAGKKVRAFTYWERVNDIDLSMIALFKDGLEEEFSWRSMWNEQSEGIVFSGDQTSGYDGGSEYFDIDIDYFIQCYPDAEYLVCCNNVYSDLNFSECLCRAGYMDRDILDSGEVFEPKTVTTAFAITCESTFACLFAIDLKKREMIWLNIGLDSDEHVAGVDSFGFLREYFDRAQLFNVHTLFSMLAVEVVENPMEADVVVTDEEFTVREGVEVIRSYDTERIFALMNA